MKAKRIVSAIAFVVLVVTIVIISIYTLNNTQTENKNEAATEEVEVKIEEHVDAKGMTVDDVIAGGHVDFPEDQAQYLADFFHVEKEDNIVTDMISTFESVGINSPWKIYDRNEDARTIKIMTYDGDIFNVKISKDKHIEAIQNIETEEFILKSEK